MSFCFRLLRRSTAGRGVDGGAGLQGERSVQSIDTVAAALAMGVQAVERVGGFVLHDSHFEGATALHRRAVMIRAGSRAGYADVGGMRAAAKLQAFPS